jgi:uncharacterized protein with HEPN domain
MLSCIATLDQFLESDPRRFLSSRLIHDASLRNLQTLTESSQRLSAELKAAHPGIPWKKLAGFRNLLVHDYLGGIDDQSVLVVLSKDIHDLRFALERIESDWLGQ